MVEWDRPVPNEDKGTWGYKVNGALEAFNGAIDDSAEAAAAAVTAASEALNVGQGAQDAVDAVAPDGDARAVGKGELVTNVRDFGATGDGTTDDTQAFQAAADYVGGLGGGSIRIPDGNYRVSMLALPTAVALSGEHSTKYAFSDTTRGATLKALAAPTTSAVIGYVITNPGTGYSSAPSVSVTGGGGSGATVNVQVSSGAVAYVGVATIGSGYTSPPTVTITGGGGSGAVLTPVMASPIVLANGHNKFRGVTFQGGNYAGSVGVAGKSVQRIVDCDFYGFDLEAILCYTTGPFIVSEARLFGCNRTGTDLGYRTGTVRMNGNDFQMSNVEVGASPSGDPDGLWNSALYLQGTAAQIANAVFEGADVGAYVTGSDNRFVNCRADINYGHGWLFTRDQAGRAPARTNYLVNCWGHRNGRYEDGAFDNFRVEPGKSAAGNLFVACRSSHSASDAWSHRYGFVDDGSSVISLFKDDGATSAPTDGVASTPDTQAFAANGTWTKPADGAVTTVIAIGAGGGGGSGRRGATGTVRSGGAGGGGGGLTSTTLSTASLGSTVNVTVGSAGVGGAAASADDTNGAAGTNGGTVTFGLHARAIGGNGGGGGTATTATGGNGGIGSWRGSVGANSAGAGAAGTVSTQADAGANGGAAGGGISSADAASNGGAGRGPWTVNLSNPVGGTAPGGAGANGTTAGASLYQPGAGGAGGASSASAAAGAGGTGGLYGGGGGGGGASVNGNASGAGGDGAPGVVFVVTT